MEDPKTAVITGATSGIGRAFADRFAEEGYDLIITGRREDLIQKAAREIIARFGVKVEVVVAELSEEAGVDSVISAAEKAGNVMALVNNAGFGLKRTFLEESLADHLKMVNVHVNATVRLTYALLPHMLQKQDGVIINVSSMAAFLPAPFNTLYGGTKSFVNAFTEALFLEVGSRGISVQSLCPGMTSTHFHEQMGVGEQVKEYVKHWMTPEEVVEISFCDLAKGKIICIPGWRNKLHVALQRLLPKRVYYTRAMLDEEEPQSPAENA